MVYQSQTQSEAQLEKEMMEQLGKIGYEKVAIPSIQHLQENFRQQLNRLNSENLKGTNLSDKEFERLLLKIEGKSVYESDKGSILFGKLRPYLKKYLYTNFDGLCSTEIWVLNSKNSRLINGFIYFFIQGAEFLEGANKSIGSKMPRADWNSVSELPFNIPSKKEQEKIVDYLGVLENKIFKEKEKLMVLEEQKKGFMQGMFL